MSKNTILQSDETEQFLIAAKRAEKQSLETLFKTCEVVMAVGDLVHQIQRERGLSNVYLASAQHFLQAKRSHQVAQSQLSENQLRQQLKGQYLRRNSSTPATARLLSCVAFVLQGLDDLKKLRSQIDALEVGAANATLVYSKLIGGLLSIVFEAADSSSDPVLSRALIALFNFMQCKEYCGQERAWGAIGFAQGVFNSAEKERLNNLQLSQERCASIYLQFAEPTSAAQWQSIEVQTYSIELQRLRRMIDQTGPQETLPSQLSEIWYDITTQRIDAMHRLEVNLLSTLAALSRSRLEVASRSLREHEVKLLSHSAPQAPNSAGEFYLQELGSQKMTWPTQTESEIPFSSKTEDGAPLSRSVYELLRQQAEHLEKTQRELHEARQALTERKLVEQAKGLLMNNLKLSEDAAFRKIQKRAMESNMKLVEVSELIIETAKRSSSKR